MKTIIFILSFLSVTFSLNNGLALTPPMGWCTWNKFHRDFTSTLFTDAADIMT